METIIEFFYNYTQGKIDRLIEVVSDITSPFYTWFFIDFYKNLSKIK